MHILSGIVPPAGNHWGTSHAGDHDHHRGHQFGDRNLTTGGRVKSKKPKWYWIRRDQNFVGFAQDGDMVPTDVEWNGPFETMDDARNDAIDCFKRAVDKIAAQYPREKTKG